MATLVPFLPETAPFSVEQRAWLNGFLAGVFGKRNSDAQPAGPAKLKILLGFGSQSGNAENFSKKLAKRFTAQGMEPTVSSLDQVNATKLQSTDAFLILTSTWGEGDMPDNAQAFWNELEAGSLDTALSQKSYAVLAFGDRNYADTFCLAGKKIDEKLTSLGAQSLTERIDCDVDFDAPAAAWEAAVKLSLAALKPAGAAASATIADIDELPKGYSKKRPFPSALKRNDLLNAPTSAKDTRHIVLDLTASELHYEAGDALGVMPRNCPGVVDHLIQSAGFPPMAEVTTPEGKPRPLRSALMDCYEIRKYLNAPPKPGTSLEEFIDGLKPLQPRLYSISSSPKAHPGEVHLTVAIVRYEENGVAQKGVASSFLADRLAIGDTTGVFVHHSPHFRLPVDANTPIIMVGPGTGIAPFRAFLEEREATAASGKNWLFFGDQRKSENYLYRTQLEAWKTSGLLTHLSLAFSRDQAEKIYVQDRLREHAAELWQWFEQGAVFYVCGDASRMAKDVETALLAVFEQHGQDGKAYLAKLKSEKRYLRDVY